MLTWVAAPGMTVRPMMLARVAAVRAEFDRARQGAALQHDYRALALAELRDRRDRAFDFAIGDTYAITPGQTLSVDAAGGVLSNDIAQPYRRVVVDTGFMLDPAYVAPSHGTLSLGPDGAFQYTPGPDFPGRDTFTYRTMTNVVAPPCAAADCSDTTATRSGYPNGDVFSNPATVVIVEPAAAPPPPACSGDIDGDSDTDILDFIVLVQHFGDSVASGTLGDLNADGQVNVLDFALFVQDFGCGP